MSGYGVLPYIDTGMFARKNQGAPKIRPKLNFEACSQCGNDGVGEVWCWPEKNCENYIER